MHSRPVEDQVNNSERREAKNTVPKMVALSLVIAVFLLLLGNRDMRQALRENRKAFENLNQRVQSVEETSRVAEQRHRATVEEKNALEEANGVLNVQITSLSANLRTVHDKLTNQELKNKTLQDGRASDRRKLTRQGRIIASQKKTIASKTEDNRALKRKLREAHELAALKDKQLKTSLNDINYEGARKRRAPNVIGVDDKGRGTKTGRESKKQKKARKRP